MFHGAEAGRWLPVQALGFRVQALGLPLGEKGGFQGAAVGILPSWNPIYRGFQQPEVALQVTFGPSGYAGGPLIHRNPQT